MLMSMCNKGIAWRGFYANLQEFVEVQKIETQLKDSDSSSGNKPDKCPHHD
jgi:hypothetical protein